MLSASIVFFREWTALEPVTRPHELELCKMLVTSSESQQMCLTISVSVAQWHLLNNSTNSQIHTEVTILPSRNIWLWCTHSQEYMMCFQGQISPPYPKAWTQCHGGARRCSFGCWRRIKRPVKGTWVQGGKTMELLELIPAAVCVPNLSAWDKSGGKQQSEKPPEMGIQSAWDEPGQGHERVLVFKTH